LSQPEQLRDRTKQFALRVIRLFQAPPKTTEAQVLGKQLLRCGTSVAANYRAACRARSRAEFISRIGIVAEEADESVLWLEMIGESNILNGNRLQEISTEAKELAAIFSASQKLQRATAEFSFTKLLNYPITKSAMRYSSPKLHTDVSTRRDPRSSDR
jgi:four helix bundle protein